LTLKIRSRLVAESFELPAKYERVERVRFSCNAKDASMFVVTASNGLVFGQWVSAVRLCGRR
jgi:hypothetical protein